jgi:molybdate transport system regulatory protein
MSLDRRTAMSRLPQPDSSPQLKLRLRLACAGDDAFGPGKAQLLESLIETASLNRTASGMKMSYVKALALVRAMNAHFQQPLVILSRGGVKGGGAQVTETGRKVLAEYQAMCAASEAAAQPGWRLLRRRLRA